MADTADQALAQLRERFEKQLGKGPQAVFRCLEILLDEAHKTANGGDAGTKPEDVGLVLLVAAKMVHHIGITMTITMLDCIAAGMTEHEGGGLTFANLHDKWAENPTGMVMQVICNKKNIPLEQVAEFIQRMPVTKPEVRRH